MIFRNAAASQKIKEPASSPRIRLAQFQIQVMLRAVRSRVSMRMVAPPARQWPETICSATSANSPALGCESASTKISQSPDAASAPQLRARAI